MRITKRLEFDAGHRLMKHEGKCRNYHGHRWVADVQVEAQDLDAVGRVVDFSEIKRRVGGWLDEHLDHGMILQDGDPLIEFLQAGGHKVFVMDRPPTSENLARLVYEKARSILTAPLSVTKVTCWETPGCFAEYP